MNRIRKTVLGCALVAISQVTLATATHQTAAQHLNDEESDPKNMGWMQGFPPAKENRITQPDSNFFSFPKLRWSVCHMQELLPTTAIKRNPYGYQPLEYDLVAGIDNIEFQPIDSETSMTWKQSLAANYTDGLLILHQGKVVYEYYSGCLN